MKRYIQHEPMLTWKGINYVISEYGERDGVDIVYVCTSELSVENCASDIFYRATPHPQFGNRYFAITNIKDKTFISNADKIEEHCFGMVEDEKGNLRYSRYRHDYRSFKNGNSIDGGRVYIRSSGELYYGAVVDGELIETDYFVKSDEKWHPEK